MIYYRDMMYDIMSNVLSMYIIMNTRCVHIAYCLYITFNAYRVRAVLRPKPEGPPERQPAGRRALLKAAAPAAARALWSLCVCASVCAHVHSRALVALCRPRARCFVLVVGGASYLYLWVFWLLCGGPGSLLACVSVVLAAQRRPILVAERTT